jgi:hypothetical protein
MSVSKVNITDIQFGGDVDAAKLRRLMQEFRKLQLTVNAVIEHAVFQPTGALAPGEFSVSVQSPGTFVIQYNDGGTIRSGTITLA